MFQFIIEKSETYTIDEANQLADQKIKENIPFRRNDDW